MSESPPSVEEFADEVSRRLNINAEAMKAVYKKRRNSVERWKTGTLYSYAYQTSWKALHALGMGNQEIRAAAWMDVVKSYMCSRELMRREEAVRESKK